MRNSKAVITNGLWVRYIPYFWGRRTSMFETVLNDPRLRLADFICSHDQTRIFITGDELRRVLPQGNLDDYGKWTFTINPKDSKIDGRPVAMVVIKKP
jgi:hypothetical protein